MVQVATLRRRSWADVAWLLVIIAAVLVALALGNTIVLLAALIAALLAAGCCCVGKRRRGIFTAGIGGMRQVPACAAQCLGGRWHARQAQVVPVAAVDGYQAVLTIDGYALVNAEGRVVYALSRELHAQTSEPVVVSDVRRCPRWRRADR